MESAIGTVVGAILGLLAFVIALTFASASNRFDARKRALLDEVNAIGTAYLRADLLPEPDKTTTQALLRDYVEVRLGMYRVFGDERKLEVVQARATSLQRLIWSHAEALEREDPRSHVYAQLTAALTPVFDLHTTRVVFGAQFRVPFFVWAALFLMSLLAMTMVGVQFGVAGRRSLTATLSLASAFALIIVLILDIDRPGGGLIDVSQRPMLLLYQQLSR